MNRDKKVQAGGAAEDLTGLQVGGSIFLGVLQEEGLEYEKHG